MTREEAKSILLNAAWLGTNEGREKIESAVEFLCGEPCDDAISRQAVLDAIGRVGMCKCSTNEIEAVSECTRAVKALPLVTAEPKTGRWIKHDNGAWWECSKCHAERAYGNEYCPDCGSHNGDIAKMVEPQESEEQT